MVWCLESRGELRTAIANSSFLLILLPFTWMLFGFPCSAYDCSIRSTTCSNFKEQVLVHWYSVSSSSLSCIVLFSVSLSVVSYGSSFMFGLAFVFDSSLLRLICKAQLSVDDAKSSGETFFWSDVVLLGITIFVCGWWSACDMVLAFRAFFFFFLHFLSCLQTGKRLYIFELEVAG